MSGAQVLSTCNDTSNCPLQALDPVCFHLYILMVRSGGSGWFVWESHAGDSTGSCVLIGRGRLGCRVRERQTSATSCMAGRPHETTPGHLAGPERQSANEDLNPRCIALAHPQSGANLRCELSTANSARPTPSRAIESGPTSSLRTSTGWEPLDSRWVINLGVEARSAGGRSSSSWEEIRKN
jgi:hypothetical protein